jgi:hypothetical protein
MLIGTLAATANVLHVGWAAAPASCTCWTHQFATRPFCRTVALMSPTSNKITLLLNCTLAVLLAAAVLGFAAGSLLSGAGSLLACAPELAEATADC